VLIDSFGAGADSEVRGRQGMRSRVAEQLPIGSVPRLPYCNAGTAVVLRLRNSGYDTGIGCFDRPIWPASRPITLSMGLPGCSIRAENHPPHDCHSGPDIPQEDQDSDGDLWRGHGSSADIKFKDRASLLSAESLNETEALQT
jgi:hypothetical protein